MEDKELLHKKEKAKKYANQPERFTLLEVKLRMESKHDIRFISFKGNKWKCTCSFYKERGTCSHTMAAEELLRSLLKS